MRKALQISFAKHRGYLILDDKFMPGFELSRHDKYMPGVHSLGDVPVRTSLRGVHPPRVVIRDGSIPKFQPILEFPNYS